MSLDKIGAGTSQITFEANRSKTEDTKEQKIATDPQNNDTFMSAEAAAGIKAAAAGGILVNKNASAQKIIGIKAEAENILNRADSIREEGKKIFEEGRDVLDEVTDFIAISAKKNFDDVTDENGNVIIKFETHGVNDKKVLDKITQFATDGTEECAVTFVNGAVETVEDFIGKVRYIYDDGVPFGIYKGYEKLSDGREKAAEAFEFAGEKLLVYGKDIEEQLNRQEKVAEVFEFDCDFGNSLREYCKGFETLSDGGEKAAERFGFRDGKFENYAENHEC